MNKEELQLRYDRAIQGPEDEQFSELYKIACDIGLRKSCDECGEYDRLDYFEIIETLKLEIVPRLDKDDLKTITAFTISLWWLDGSGYWKRDSFKAVNLRAGVLRAAILHELRKETKT